MAWDLEVDHTTGDLTGGLATGQDEIVQRIQTRLFRHLGEWFVNTTCGLPWYRGRSTLMPDQLTEQSAILGSRGFRYADGWIRREILDTDGVLQLVQYSSHFDETSRTFSIAAQIATEFGLAYVTVERQLTNGQ